ncbi:MAG: alpha/beta fold hydrolase [Myxococcota bacterium]
MPTLERDGTHLYYEVHGSGPAILLTHGFSATSQMWAPQIEALSREHTLVLWDLCGHGRSGAPEQTLRYREAPVVADLEALLDQVGADRAVVGGLSLGGYLSLAFALDHPNRVAGLLIIDTGPGFKRDDKREEWNAMMLEHADAIATRGFDALLGNGDPRLGSHSATRGLELAARHMLVQHSPRVIEGLPRLDVPALVVVGAEDTSFRAAADYMAQELPRATKAVIEDAGHTVNLDQPEVFDRVVLDFLESHGL